jgi:hypothetical protein
MQGKRHQSSGSSEQLGARAQTPEKENHTTSASEATPRLTFCGKESDEVDLMAAPMTGKTLWEVETPIGFRIRITRAHWEMIVTIKHPVMAGREEVVRATLAMPEEIRRSRSDPTVYLFYRAEAVRRWVCVVAKRLNGEGFVITTYPTDVVKEGEQIWPK